MHVDAVNVDCGCCRGECWRGVRRSGVANVAVVSEYIFLF